MRLGPDAEAKAVSCRILPFSPISRLQAHVSLETLWFDTAKSGIVD